jgi:hypothetical protein
MNITEAEIKIKVGCHSTTSLKQKANNDFIQDYKSLTDEMRGTYKEILSKISNAETDIDKKHSAITFINLAYSIEKQEEEDEEEKRRSIK